jgi:hypothetical protein
MLIQADIVAITPKIMLVIVSFHMLGELLLLIAETADAVARELLNWRATAWRMGAIAHKVRGIN